MRSWLVAAGLVVAVPAAAQQPYIFTAVGYQQLTSIAAATALTLPVGQPVRIIEVCVETAAVRYRDDGTDPTASVGIPVAIGVCFQYSANIPGIKFIQQTSGAVVNVSYYR